MPIPEPIQLKRSCDNHKYDQKKIRVLLMSDVLRFCTDDKIIKAMQSATRGSEALNELRQIVTQMKYGKETVYAAIVLAIYQDASGTGVLKNYQKFWSTSSEIEKLHVRAALILLNDLPQDKFHFANTAISYELTKEVQN